MTSDWFEPITVNKVEHKTIDDQKRFKKSYSDSLSTHTVLFCTILDLMSLNYSVQKT